MRLYVYPRELLLRSPFAPLLCRNGILPGGGEHFQLNLHCFFHEVAELPAEARLAEGLFENGLCSIAHSLQFGGWHRLKPLDGGDRPGNIAMGDCRADVVIVEEIADVRGPGSEKKNRATRGHRAVNFARVDDAE